MIPQEDNSYNDLLDAVITACSTTEYVDNKDGTTTKKQVINQNTLWWKTQDISATTFGRQAYELEEWERLSLLCAVNMNRERAQQYAAEIIEIAGPYRRSIDAKSSESRRDKENSKSVLLDKINRTTTERIYTDKSDKADGFLAGLGLQRQKQDDMRG